jgi:hypothetical protein
LCTNFSKFERGRSLIRNLAIKTKDGYKHYQRYQGKKERIVFFGYLKPLFFFKEVGSNLQPSHLKPTPG